MRFQSVRECMIVSVKDETIHMVTHKCNKMMGLDKVLNKLVIILMLVHERHGYYQTS